MKMVFLYQNVWNLVKLGVDPLGENPTEAQRVAHKEAKKKDYKDLFIINQRMNPEQGFVYLINMIPTKILNSKSSYEVLYNEVSDLSSLMVFGCLSYASTLPVNRHKFDSRAKKCAFLGYKSGIKGFALVDVHTSEILISRNVKFFDLEFPFQSSSVISVPATQIYVDSRHTDMTHRVTQ